MKKILAIIMPIIIAIICIASLLHHWSNNDSYEDYVANRPNSELYDDVIEDVGESTSGYTKNNNVNYAIDELVNKYGFGLVDVVDKFYNEYIDSDVYTIAFDNSVLYHITVDKDGVVYLSEGDYEFWFDE